VLAVEARTPHGAELNLTLIDERGAVHLEGSATLGDPSDAEPPASATANGR
jgi:hypothetical protein